MGEIPVWGWIIMLAWILGFTIPGIIKVKNGSVWGILLATIGLAFLGAVWAFCYYELYKKDIEIKRIANLVAKLNAVEEKISDKQDNN
ncbi:hypothetical protein [Spiroplasma sp. BIUS-1]|uniref:hypothetical protein n=1 Tax=Spiroplasma sp. BIUS-1 TaxID=216964 RepID=UPI001396EA5C|nr:hypothetical protein [Spiroplasma sp. BIUS-1]QHX36779.1 hypothetical protein SBIUS_v1c05260 [Spiroplasma sp. BIUS-1]